MSRGKKVTPQTLIAEAGIALIHKRVTEMGYLFHPRRVDHGIDGHIDLVDPGTREVLNLVLLVQSKASGLPFAYETDTSFQYTCDETDLNYWLSGNAPVILILSHPAQDLAWWVDIKAEFADAKRRAQRTATVDKRLQAFDASAAGDLLRRAVPKESGLNRSDLPAVKGRLIGRYLSSTSQIRFRLGTPQCTVAVGGRRLTGGCRSRTLAVGCWRVDDHPGRAVSPVFWRPRS